MKKILLLMTSAMLLFAGCAKEELTSEPQEIGFRAYNFKQTKAPIEGAVYGETDPMFKVFAALVREGDYAVKYASSEKYFETVVAYDGSDSYKIWRPYNVTGANYIKYYWPMEGSLTFVAVSPSDATSAFNNTTATLTVTDFSLSANVAGQADLMYTKIADAADLTANTTAYTGSTKNGVPVVFNHALSQIRFKAYNKEAAANTIQIDNIQLTNVANKGTLTVVNDAVSNVDPSVDGWLTTTDSDADFVSLSTAKVTTGTAVEFGLPVMALPQTLADDIMLKVTYTMTHINGEDVPDTQKTVSKKLIEVVGAQLNANKKYTITLGIGADEILFSPSVTVWSDTAADERFDF